jgi:hypothetical protein
MVSIYSCSKQDNLSAPAKQSNIHLSDASVALDWYKLQLRLLLERNSTMNGAYFAYLGIGLYESVQPGITGARSLSFVLNQMPLMPQKEINEGYNWEVSANAAMAALLRSFNTGLTTANLATIDSLENAYNQKLNPSAGTKFKRSQAFGRSIALAVRNWSLTDGYNPSNAGYSHPQVEGGWAPTPPAFVNPPVMPFMSSARLLVSSTANVVADPPTTYSTDVTSDFYAMVEEVYDVSQTLTQEQRDIALFWVDQGNTTGFTPPGHDFSVILQALATAGADLGTAAETLAKAGIAEHDGTIMCFRAKYTHNLVRPVTYIQSYISAGWLPLIPTPPHPEYPAAHAFVTGSALKAAERVIGQFEITDHTYDFRGWSARTYSSLSDAVAEAGISRLYGGIHYRPSIEVGLELGFELGTIVGDLDLTQ